MSVHFANRLTSLIPIAVLLASLIGSGHCVTMCGGLVLATVEGPFSWLTYQLGRLIGYLFLGAWIGG